MSGYERTVVQEIASTVGAYKRCLATGNEYSDNHSATLGWIESQFLPSGAGIDNGTKIDRNETTESKVVLTFSFHHMDEYGGYDGWTDYKAIITPAFQGVDVRIVGSNRNEIKDYLHDILDHALDQVCLKYTDGRSEHGRYLNDKWTVRA